MFWAWRVLRWWHSGRVCQLPTMDWVQSRLASCACCEQMETSRVVRALPRAESSTSAGRSSVPGLSQRTSVQRRTHRSELPLARLAPRVPFLNAQQEHQCPASRCCRPHRPWAERVPRNQDGSVQHRQTRPRAGWSPCKDSLSRATCRRHPHCQAREFQEPSSSRLSRSAARRSSSTCPEIMRCKCIRCWACGKLWVTVPVLRCDPSVLAGGGQGA